jgi:hypothetical protein
MAPGAGVDFLDRHVPENLDIPKEVIKEHEEVSAIALLLQLFSAEPRLGTSSWVSTSSYFLLLDEPLNHYELTCSV